MAIGSSINAGLNRPDYSGIMQGAQSSANSRMQGAQAMAQGYAALGQGVGNAIQQYTQKKEEKAKLEGVSSAVAKFVLDNPLPGVNLPKDKDGKPDVKAITQFVKDVGADNAWGMLKSARDDAANQEKLRLDQENRLVENIAGAVASGQPMPPNIPPELMQRAAVRAQELHLGLSQARANIANTQSETASRLASKPKNLSFEEQAVGQVMQQMLDANGGQPLTATQKAKAYADVKAMGRAQTNINVGDSNKLAELAFQDFQTQLKDEITPLVNSKAYLNEMSTMLDGGDVISGAFANAELTARSILNKAGISNDPKVAATQAYMASAVMRVGEIIKMFGAGTGLSDADREYAAKAAAGDITMDEAGLRRILEMGKKVTQSRGKNYTSALNRTFGGQDDEQSVFALRRLSIPEDSYSFSEKEDSLPDGIDPEDWNYMTPEQKKLFQ